MKKIKLISDSTCDLSERLIKEHDIHIVPLHVSFGEETYRDGIDLNTEGLYKKVSETGSLPKSSAASPGEFETVFKQYLEQGYQVLYLGIGSKFSGTYQSANVAKNMLESDDIVLVDSQNLSSGIGLLLLKAASFRQQGDDILTIKNKLEALVPKVRSQFVIDTLEYLYKGGRLNALSALMGKMLRIHPLIKVVDGEMIVGKKARGSMRKGLNIMLDEALEVKDAIDPEFMMITHSLADESYQYLKEKIDEEFTIEKLHETHAGCTNYTHCGAGTIRNLYIIK